MGKSGAKPAYSDRGVMLKKPKRRILFFLSFFVLSVFLTTCGLEEYYYLPQVPEVNIETQFNTSATLNLPSLSGYYYAQNYKIFYRIYISDNIITSNETSIFNVISSTLVSDYNLIWPNTDPTSTSMGTSAGTLFTNRNYYELFIDNNNRGENIDSLLTSNGGNVSILFPTAQGSYPVLSVSNGSNSVEYRLLRSDYFFNLNPNDDKRYFRNTSDINVSDYADLVPRTGASQTYAYVSMYIVASGINPTGFTPIYSKPTHISVFKLPDN
jgi:hypothetical protein